MSDLIEQAVKKWQDTKQKEAKGSHDDHKLIVKKETYQKDQLGPSRWRVAVYFTDGGESITPESEADDLEPDEAENIFNNLCEKYDLDRVSR